MYKKNIINKNFLMKLISCFIFSYLNNFLYFLPYFIAFDFSSKKFMSFKGFDVDSLIFIEYKTLPNDVFTLPT